MNKCVGLLSIKAFSDWRLSVSPNSQVDSTPKTDLEQTSSWQTTATLKPQSAPQAPSPVSRKHLESLLWVPAALLGPFHYNCSSTPCFTRSGQSRFPQPPNALYPRGCKNTELTRSPWRLCFFFICGYYYAPHSKLEIDFFLIYISSYSPQAHHTHSRTVPQPDTLHKMSLDS